MPIFGLDSPESHQYAPKNHEKPSSSPRNRHGLPEAGNLHAAPQVSLTDKTRPFVLLESGDLYEAALFAEEAARRAVQERDPHLALDLLNGVLHRVVRHKERRTGTNSSRHCLEGCRLKIHLVRGMEDVPKILEKAQIIAERLGDRRTLARIDLMNGLLHYVKGETSRGVPVHCRRSGQGRRAGRQGYHGDFRGISRDLLLSPGPLQGGCGLL